MLDLFLEAAYTKTKQAEAQSSMQSALEQLPLEELMAITRGESSLNKLAHYSGDDPMCWLEHFQGTALYEEALAIEKRQLELDMQRNADQQKSQGVYNEQDVLRVKRKMLELQLAEQAGGGGDELQAMAPDGSPEGVAQTATPAPMGEGAMNVAKTAFKKTAIVDLLVAGGLGAHYGGRKAEQAGHDYHEGATRGALGAGGGYLGGSIGGGLLGGALGGKPGLIAGALGGGYLGGSAGYRHATSQYDKPSGRKSKTAASTLKAKGFFPRASQLLSGRRTKALKELGERRHSWEDVKPFVRTGDKGWTGEILKREGEEEASKVLASRIGAGSAAAAAGLAANRGSKKEASMRFQLALTKQAFNPLQAAKNVGQLGMHMAKANPTAAMGLAGAGLGAAGGAIAGGEGHRLSGALKGGVMGGAAGAATGFAAPRVSAGMAKGQTFGEAAKGTFGQARNALGLDPRVELGAGDMIHAKAPPPPAMNMRTVRPGQAPRPGQVPPSNGRANIADLMPPVAPPTLGAANMYKFNSAMRFKLALMKQADAAHIGRLIEDSLQSAKKVIKPSALGGHTYEHIGNVAKKTTGALQAGALKMKSMAGHHPAVGGGGGAQVMGW